MSIISKFFSNKATHAQPQEPDNDHVLLLLNEWKQNPTLTAAESVLREFYEGNTYLLLPVVNSPSNSADWNTLNTDVSIQLKSVSSVDGFKVLAAFTDSEALNNWSNEDTEVITMLTKDLLKHCRINTIDKIIINKNSSTEFELGRSNNNVKTEVLKTGTEILIGPPKTALDTRIIKKLITSFEKVEVIKEAYQYEMCWNKEYTFVIGIRLAVNTDNSKSLLRNAVNNALFEETLDRPLDIVIMDNEELLQKVRDIANSVFYVSNSK